MADDAVGRLNISSLGGPVVAFSAITVTRTSVEGSNCVALLTGIGVMGKNLSCCGSRGASTTVRMTDKAFSRIERIMPLD